jgi:hypothetical protein
MLTSVCGGLTRHSDPPLGGGQGGRVDHKLVGGTIVGRGSLQSTQVGGMSQLSLQLKEEKKGAGG